MAGAEIQIEVNDQEVRDLFRQLSQRMGNLEPVFRIIGETVKTSVIKNFKVGGRFSAVGSYESGANKWAPLKPSTIARKQNKSRVLIEEGHLINSINFW